MPYRVCKAFEIESGHMLSKHPGRCRYPHGHSRRVEVVLSADTLDALDMVVDFKALKLALEDFLDSFDHALVVNSEDPAVRELPRALTERLIVLENEDPTTEVLARRIHDFLKAELASGRAYRDGMGNGYTLRPGLRIDRVRVGETSSSWAEYFEDHA